MNEDSNFSKFKFFFMAGYCSVVTVLSFCYFFAITFCAIPKDNIQNANLILGFLIGSAISTFLGYYFGMSQSSSAHNDRDKTNPPGTVVSGTSTTDVHTESIITKPVGEEVKVEEVKSSTEVKADGASAKI